MKSLTKLILVLALTAFSFVGVSHTQASGGDHYSSYWTCSDGNTYGLVAYGSQREFYLPTGAAPIFFKGVKTGNWYEGSVKIDGCWYSVCGPVSHCSTKITLSTTSGYTWVFHYSHK
ncbi:MAG: hypothetical protein AAF236_04915 [Verrucomicrobiota bacterium]